MSLTKKISFELNTETAEKLAARMASLPGLSAHQVAKRGLIEWLNAAPGVLVDTKLEAVLTRISTLESRLDEQLRAALATSSRANFDAIGAQASANSAAFGALALTLKELSDGQGKLGKAFTKLLSGA